MTNGRKWIFENQACADASESGRFPGKLVTIVKNSCAAPHDRGYFRRHTELCPLRPGRVIALWPVVKRISQERFLYSSVKSWFHRSGVCTLAYVHSVFFRSVNLMRRAAAISWGASSETRFVQAVSVMTVGLMFW